MYKGILCTICLFQVKDMIIICGMQEDGTKYKSVFISEFWNRPLLPFIFTQFVLAQVAKLL